VRREQSLAHANRTVDQRSGDGFELGFRQGLLEEIDTGAVDVETLESEQHLAFRAAELDLRFFRLRFERCHGARV
jgi:hypothetical protein